MVPIQPHNENFEFLKRRGAEYPRPKVKVVGKTSKGRCGNNSPTRIHVATVKPFSCLFVIKFPTLFTYKQKT